MQRSILILACFFIPMAIGSVNCFAQQYPFVHYTPKDGLASNWIRNIYQDSRRRIYFSTLNGQNHRKRKKRVGSKKKMSNEKTV